MKTPRFSLKQEIDPVNTWTRYEPYPHVSISSSLDSLSVAGIEVIDVANVPWDFLALSAFLGLCFNLTLNFGVAYTYERLLNI